MLQLIAPDIEHLNGYLAALRQGWSSDNLRPEATQEEIDAIERDPGAFVTEQDDRDGNRELITLPDGRQVPRLPGYHRWLWDGEFCGVIGFRWQPGTTDLPPYCLGHIGFSVVPWKQRRGYGTRALQLMLPEAWDHNMPFVELTCDDTNLGSRKVIEANGGEVFEMFDKPESYGGALSRRYRVHNPR